MNILYSKYNANIKDTKYCVYTLYLYIGGIIMAAIVHAQFVEKRKFVFIEMRKKMFMYVEIVLELYIQA